MKAHHQLHAFFEPRLSTDAVYQLVRTNYKKLSSHCLWIGISAFVCVNALAVQEKTNASSTTTVAVQLSEKTATSNKPVQTNQDAQLVELVFVIDTTGSMGGLLEGAKAKIWSIVNNIMQKPDQQNMRVKVGLVAFRDRGDAYVTKLTQLTDNLDQVYSELTALRAEGGGDTPEDVRTALHQAVSKMAWSKASASTSQIIFLVGDAPPHNDYVDVPSVESSVKLARSKGILVNAIQCGALVDTTAPWRQVAQLGGGEYFSIAQNGGVDLVATPQDTELAILGERIGATYLAYGRADERKAKMSRQLMLEEKVVAVAPAAARAERAVNKAINTRAYDESDLLQKIESGQTSLSRLKDEELPDGLLQLKPEDRQRKIDEALQQRNALKKRIVELSKQRDQYLSDERLKKKSAKSDDQLGFDSAVSSTLERQIK
jgi:hypothetical protein